MHIYNIYIYIYICIQCTVSQRNPNYAYIWVQMDFCPYTALNSDLTHGMCPYAYLKVSFSKIGTWYVQVFRCSCLYDIACMDTVSNTSKKISYWTTFSILGLPGTCLWQSPEHAHFWPAQPPDITALLRAVHANWHVDLYVFECVLWVRVSYPYVLYFEMCV